MARSLAPLLLLTLASCVDPELSTVEIHGRCTPEYCGTNSPIIKVYRSFDFNLDGLPNSEGIRVLGMSKGHYFYTLNVSGGRIFGTLAGSVLEEKDLLDAKIWVELPDQTKASITITEVGSFYEVTKTGGLIETYVLKWAPVLSALPSTMNEGGKFGSLPEEGAQSPVCERTEESADDLGFRMYESAVFEGDRFDPVTLTVDPTPDNRWFNVACGKHLLSKLRLTRNTINTAKTWQHVQAAMKMFSADYCGTGQPYTIAGVPITLRDTNQMLDYDWRAPKEVEARWSENGALCLQTPRFADRNTVCPVQPPPMVPRPNRFGWVTSPGPSIAPPPRSSIPYCSDLDPRNFEFGNELVTSAHY